MFPFDVANLFNSLSALSGRSRLPVFELDKKTVQSKWRKIRRPLTISPETKELQLDFWRLAHTTKKADFASRFSPFLGTLSTFGFFIRNIGLLDWNADNLRLTTGMSNTYTDFSRTSLSGRLAQSMTLLFLDDQGYAYVNRFSDFLNSAEKDGLAIAKRALKRKRTSDFIFEKHSTSNNPVERALVESKGGFVTSNTNPRIKRNLKNGLEQLNIERIQFDRLIIPIGFSEWVLTI
jgi:hypothetical protein